MITDSTLFPRTLARGRYHREMSNPSKRRGAKDDEETNWIQCGNCKAWLDYLTTGLTLPYVEKQVKKLQFTCRLCILTSKVEQLTEECTELRERVAKLEAEKTSGQQILSNLLKVPDEIIEIKSNITTLEGTCTNLPTSLSSSTLSPLQLRQAVDEAQETEKRKLNLIAVGLPERSSDMEDVIEYAKNECSIGIPLDASDFIACERLGRPTNNGRPRLLRVKLKSSIKRRTILAMRRKSPSDRENSLNIFFRPDLTQAQQEVDKKLREELALAGKDKFMIRRGRIVPREQATETNSSSGTNSLAVTLPASPSATMVKTISSPRPPTSPRRAPLPQTPPPPSSTAANETNSY